MSRKGQGPFLSFGWGRAFLRFRSGMSQFAENTDGFEVEGNDAPETAAPVAVVARAEPADDVTIDAPAGRQPNGRFAKADAAPEPEAPADRILPEMPPASPEGAAAP